MWLDLSLPHVSVFQLPLIQVGYNSAHCLSLALIQLQVCFKDCASMWSSAAQRVQMIIKAAETKLLCIAQWAKRQRSNQLLHEGQMSWWPCLITIVCKWLLSGKLIQTLTYNQQLRNHTQCLHNLLDWGSASNRVVSLLWNEYCWGQIVLLLVFAQ